jgi:hypothetical protein
MKKTYMITLKLHLSNDSECLCTKCGINSICCISNNGNPHDVPCGWIKACNCGRQSMRIGVSGAIIQSIP